MNCLNPYSIGRYSVSSSPQMRPPRGGKVLILILLEDTLWVKLLAVAWRRSRCLNPYSIGRYSVRVNLPFHIHLIYGLNPYSIGRYSVSVYGFGEMQKLFTSLNPYSIGRYSVSLLRFDLLVENISCLIPYSIGRYSVSHYIFSLKKRLFCVLILILLEDTLWDVELGYFGKTIYVLILILLEDTLWAKLKCLTKKYWQMS